MRALENLRERRVNTCTKMDSISASGRLRAVHSDARIRRAAPLSVRVIAVGSGCRGVYVCRDEIQDLDMFKFLWARARGSRMVATWHVLSL